MTETLSEIDALPVAPPAVTVISTCYNQEDLVGRAIESVIAQSTSATVDHIICDDGSDDNSPAVLREWEAKHPDRIRILEVTNRNMAGAFNAALMSLKAATEYVVVLAGDDWLADNFVEECLNAIGDADMVIPAMRRSQYPGHDDGKLEMPEVRHPTLDQVWEWETTHAWAVALFRRDAIVETGGFHHGTGGDCDWDMWIDLVARGRKFAYTNKTWFYYRYVATSMNRTKTAEVWDAARREMRRHHRRRTLPGPEFS